MALGAIRAGKAFVELFAENNLDKGLKAGEARLRKYGAVVAKVGAGIAAAGASMGAVMLGSAKSFARIGDAINKAGGRTGIAAKELSTLKFAAERSGASLADLESGIKGMQRNIGQLGKGTKTQADAFGKLGLSMGDLQGLAPDEQFKLIADRLSEIEDPTTRNALAMDTMGRSAGNLANLIGEGADGINRLQQEAKDLNLEISDEESKKAAGLADAFGDVGSQIKMVFFKIGAALAEPLTKILNLAKPLLSWLISFIENNQWMVKVAAMVAGALGAVGTALMAIGTAGIAVSFLSTAIGAISTAIAAVAPFVPVILAVTAGVLAAIAVVGGLGFAMFKLGKWFLTSTEMGRNLAKTFVEIKDKVVAVIKGIFNAFKAGDFALAGEIAMAALKVAWLTGMVFLKESFGDTVSHILQNVGDMVTGMVNAITTGIQTLIRVAIQAAKYLPNGAKIVEGLQKADKFVGETGAGIAEKIKEFTEFSADANRGAIDEAQKELDAKIAEATMKAEAIEAENKKISDNAAQQMAGGRRTSSVLQSSQSVRGLAGFSKDPIQQKQLEEMKAMRQEMRGVRKAIDDHEGLVFLQ